MLPIQLLWTHYESFEPDATKVPTGPANWLSLAMIVGYPVISIARYGQQQRQAGDSVVRPCRRPTSRLAGIDRAVRRVVRPVPHRADRPAGPRRCRQDREVLQVILMAAVYLPIPFDDQRRGIHDRVARTRVVTELPPLLARTDRPDGAEMSNGPTVRRRADAQA